MTDIAQSSRSSSAIQVFLDQQLSRPSVRKILLFAVAAGLLTFLVYSFDVAKVAHIISELNPVTFVLVLVAMMGAFAVSCLRFHTIVKAIGVDIPRDVAFRANLLGIIGGMIFFQLAGQTISRAAILRGFGVTTAQVFLANVYERLSAAFWLLGLALISAFILFGTVQIDLLGGGTAMIKLLLLLAAAFAAASLFAWRRIMTVTLRRLSASRFAKGFAAVSLSTVIVHIFMLLAYVHLARTVAPSAGTIDIFAASAIIMFAASIPISFAGWGVREVSAVYAYGAIGLSPEQALTISVTIGVLSLLLLTAMSLLTLSSGMTSVKPTPCKRMGSAHTGRINVDRLLCWVLPLIAGVVVFFQVYMPAGIGKLNVNLADPVVIAGGILFLVHYVRLPTRAKVWRVDRFEMLIVLATLSVLVAFALGVSRMGVTDWALYNRLLGWFVLVAYCATGALIALAAGEAGRKTLLLSIITVGAVLVVSDYFVFWLSLLKFPIEGFLKAGPFNGMSQNSNAFAFQLLVLLGLVLTILPQTARDRGNKIPGALQIALATLFLVGLIYTGSRTGLIVSACLFSAVVMLGWISAWRAVLITLCAAFAYFLPALIGGLLEVMDHLQAGGAASGIDTKFAIEMVRPSSDTEHWYSITQALQLWREYPLWGSGLGAFIATVQSEEGTQLVIHNTAVWLLAEFGLVGLALFAGIFSLILMAVWRPALSGDTRARAVVCLLLVFAVFQLAHDIFYQRIFWFVLGALLVQGKIRWHSKRDSAGV